MKKHFRLWTFLALSLLLSPTTVFAGDTVDTGLGKINGDPTNLVNDILRIALGAAGGIAFLLIIYGGFKLTFSRGDPQAVQDGREVITSAIIGLIIVIFSVFLLRLIGIDILGLPL